MPGKCTSIHVYERIDIFGLRSASPFNSLIGGQDDQIYLVVSDIGTESGQGLDFINGQTFLERFYAVFDTANSRVGIANTPFTDATTN